jgi:hypothetical protein
LTPRLSEYRLKVLKTGLYVKDKTCVVSNRFISTVAAGVILTRIVRMVARASFGNAGKGNQRLIVLFYEMISAGEVFMVPTP